MHDLVIPTDTPFSTLLEESYIYDRTEVVDEPENEHLEDIVLLEVDSSLVVLKLREPQDNGFEQQEQDERDDALGQ